VVAVGDLKCARMFRLCRSLFVLEIPNFFCNSIDRFLFLSTPPSCQHMANDKMMPRKDYSFSQSAITRIVLFHLHQKIPSIPLAIPQPNKIHTTGNPSKEL
jgi:hypothetical protein